MADDCLRIPKKRCRNFRIDGWEIQKYLGGSSIFSQESNVYIYIIIIIIIIIIIYYIYICICILALGFTHPEENPRF